MTAVPAILARGGSSRGLLIHADALKGYSEAERREAFAFAVGSPDPDARQVNGVGGGNATTSKVAVISPSKTPGHDVDYEFYQVIVASGASERRGTCGNLVAAVGQFAIEQGLVQPTDPVTRVRIHDVNTGQTIAVEVPTAGGKVIYKGAHVVAGVPGTGAAIPVRFMEPAGRVTGKLHPSGTLSDNLAIDGRDYEVSLIDAVNPVVLVHATSLAASTPWSIAGIEGDTGLCSLMERARANAAVRFGLADDESRAGEQSPFLPFVGLYWDRAMQGRPVPTAITPAPWADVSVRLMSGGLPHRAVPLSAGLATATLARLRALTAGAADVAGPHGIALEHPSGRLDVEVEAHPAGPRVVSVGVTLTARRIMSGMVEF
jgi:2-methylaconitate cis-trans-isomerase PrpF